MVWKGVGGGEGISYKKASGGDVYIHYVECGDHEYTDMLKLIKLCINFSQ